MRNCLGMGLLLIGLALLLGMALLPLVSQQVRDEVKLLHCSNREFLATSMTEYSVDRPAEPKWLYQCVDPGRAARDVTVSYLLSALGMSFLPILFGIVLLAVGKKRAPVQDFQQVQWDAQPGVKTSHQQIIITSSNFGEPQVFTSGEGINLEAVLDMALDQLEMARKAGMISEEDFQRAKQKIESRQS